MHSIFGFLRHLPRPPPQLPPEEEQYHELSPYATVLLDSRPAARQAMPATHQEPSRQTAWHQTDTNRQSDARQPGLDKLTGWQAPPVHCQHHLGLQSFNQVAACDMYFSFLIHHNLHF